MLRRVTLASLTAGERQVVEFVRRGVELAMEKAWLHYEQPATYPIGNNTSFEAVLSRRIGEMKAASRALLKPRVLKWHGEGTAARRAHFGELSVIDQRSALAIEDQVRAEAAKQGHTLPAAPSPRVPAIGALAVSKLAPRQAAGQVTATMIAESVTCIKTSDLRTDELTLTGSFFALIGGNATGSVELLDDKVRRGDVVPLNRAVGSVVLPASPAAYPGVLFAEFAAVERDLRKDDRELYLDVREALLAFTAVVATWILFLLPGLPVTLPIIIVSAAILLGIWLIGDLYAVFFADEILEGAADQINLGQPPSAGAAPLRGTVDISQLILRNRGHYRVAYRWEFS